MELKSKTADEVTIRFARKEFGDLLAVVHSAAIEYENLTADIHNLSKQQVEKLEDDLYGLV